MRVFNGALIMFVVASCNQLLPADMQQPKHVSDLELLVTQARHAAAARNEQTSQLVNHLYVMPLDIVNTISEYVMPDPTKTAYPLESLRQKIDWLSLNKDYARKYEQDIRNASDALWYSHGYTHDECARALHRNNYWVRHEKIIGCIQTNNLEGLVALVNICKDHNKYINWDYTWCYHNSCSGEIHSFLQRAIHNCDVSYELALYVLGQGARPELVSNTFFAYYSHKNPIRCLLLHGLRPTIAMIHCADLWHCAHTDDTKKILTKLCAYGTLINVDASIMQKWHPSTQSIVCKAQEKYATWRAKNHPFFNNYSCTEQQAVEDAWYTNCYKHMVNQEVPVLYKHYNAQEQGATIAMLCKRYAARGKNSVLPSSTPVYYDTWPDFNATLHGLFQRLGNASASDTTHCMHELDKALAHRAGCFHVHSGPHPLHTAITLPVSLKVSVMKKLIAHGMVTYQKSIKGYTLLHKLIVDCNKPDGQENDVVAALVLQNDRTFRDALYPFDMVPLVNYTNMSIGSPLETALSLLSTEKNLTHANKPLWRMIHLLLKDPDIDLATMSRNNNMPILQLLCEKVFMTSNAVDQKKALACMHIVAQHHATHPVWYIKDSLGNTPFADLFIRFKVSEIDAEYIAPLLKHNCVDAQNIIYHTIWDRLFSYPIHEAVRADNQGLVKLLMQYNADPLLRDWHGYTAMQCALDNKPMLAILLGNQSVPRSLANRVVEKIKDYWFKFLDYKE